MHKAEPYATQNPEFRILFYLKALPIQIYVFSVTAIGFVQSDLQLTLVLKRDGTYNSKRKSRVPGCEAQSKFTGYIS